MNRIVLFLSVLLLICNTGMADTAQSDEQALDEFVDRVKVNRDRYKKNQDGQQKPVLTNNVDAPAAETSDGLLDQAEKNRDQYREDNESKEKSPVIMLQPASNITVKSEEKLKAVSRPSLPDWTSDASYVFIPINAGISTGMDVNTYSSGGKKIVNNISINLFMSGCDRLYGFNFGLFNFISEEMQGVQTGVFMNTTGYFAGLQAAGFINISADYTWAQAAGFMNISKDFLGIQGAGFMNISGDAYGVQGSGFMNVSANLWGAQGSGFMNIAGDVRGVQAAGFMNISADLYGVQVSTFNMAGNVAGVQAGVINIADDVKGVQAGILNIGGGDSYVPIGLFSIVTRGAETHLQVSMDESGIGYVTLAHGTRNVYNIYSIGKTLDSGLWLYGLGLGCTLLLGPVYLSIEGNSYGVTDIPVGISSLLSKIKLEAGFSFARNFALFAGVSLNGFYKFNSSHEVHPITENLYQIYNVRVWPGFYAGVRF